MRSHRVARRLAFVWLLLGIASLLAGCADAPPSPTPFSLASTQTPTLVPPRAPASTFTATSTPLPTFTPTPSMTPTPAATATPTSTPTPTATPTPTPEPSAQLEAARRFQINGDYAQAIDGYLALLADDPTPEQARQTRYYLAEAYVSSHDYATGAAAWEEFIVDYPGDARLPAATLMAALALVNANECERAIPYFEIYLSFGTALTDVTYGWMADCLAGDAQLDEAVLAYRRALDTTSDRVLQADWHEKLAGLFLAQQDYEAALVEYEAILKVARVESYRAKIEYLAGQALAAIGQADAAHARYRRAFENYPEAEYAYLALVELVDAGVEVDEFQRGLVDYHAGAAYPDAYEAAIRAFDRYLASQPASKADAALYYKALTLRALDQPDKALQLLEDLIASYPDSNWLARAWQQKAITYAQMGDTEQAVKAYQDLAAFFPADELAPNALWRAAKLREGENAPSEAAALLNNLQVTFPGFKDADEALWRAGLAHYRAGSPADAIADWEALLDKYPASAYRPKTLYWLGKVGASVEVEGGANYWDQLVTANPQTYYALRVQQIRAGDSLTVTRLITTALPPPDWDAAKAGEEILSWLRTWTRVPTDTTSPALPVTVTRRLDFRRGEALLEVGLRRDALAAFDGVRSAAWQDPVMLAQLALYFREQGLYGLAARSASRLASLPPTGTLQDAPLALRQLAYPLVYADLLSAEAQRRGLDPLLIAALVRQESLFEPVAESYAGARGLGQVMPATGEGIARNLGMEDFSLDDLYLPWVSIRFAAYYLAVQMQRFDNQILISLAAYNGGPGNALRWLEMGGEDLDLLVEVITSAQSRLYLQRVYEQYLTYEELYRAAEVADL